MLAGSNARLPTGLRSAADLLLPLLLLALLHAQRAGAALPPCSPAAPAPPPANLTSEEQNKRQDASNAIALETFKSCLNTLQEMSDVVNHFYVVGINESFTISVDLCAQSEADRNHMKSGAKWIVALRGLNKHVPLFSYPLKALKKIEEIRKSNPKVNPQLTIKAVESLPFASDYCMTQTGNLYIRRFRPEMAGTYMLDLSGVKPGLLNGTTGERSLLESAMHHLDFIYSREESFEGRNLRQEPQLAPKASGVRMITTVQNLRYKYRTRNATMGPMPMQHKQPKEYLYPKDLFLKIGIQMFWAPPPLMTQFSDWKPFCGPKITRDRFMQCAMEINRDKLENRILEFNRQMTANLESNYQAGKMEGIQWNEAHILALVYHLLQFSKRVKEQLITESQQTPGQRKLFTSGIRILDRDGIRVQLPCHYTYLHHLPSTAIMTEGAASLFLPRIPNIGEREVAVRLCGVTSPLEVLQLMGRVLVDQLRRLVSMTKRRPVVPQRSVIYVGKTMYMRCPVDPHKHEQPACNVPGVEDNILWTMNGKTIRYFGEDAERGVSLSPSCGLTIKKINFFDQGEYVCYRTPWGKKSIEDTPAYRHFMTVIKPEYDPPPVEEVYFGLAVSFAWNGVLLLLWLSIATVKGFLGLQLDGRETQLKPEVWTSFYDHDPTLEDDFSTESEEEPDDTDEVDLEEDKQGDRAIEADLLEVHLQDKDPDSEVKDKDKGKGMKKTVTGQKDAKAGTKQADSKPQQGKQKGKKKND